MSNNTPLDDDLDTKPRYEDEIEVPHNNTKKKRNRWITIGLAAFLVTSLLSAVVAIPISLTQKSKNIISNDENINQITSDESINQIPSDEIISQVDNSSTENKVFNADTNITAASLPSKKISRNQLLLTTDKSTSFHPPGYAHEISPYSNLIRLKTFTPPDEGRIFVMGDVHGCIDEMNALLEKIKFQTNKDVLILTGDLVFRGKDSIGVIRRAKELNALCVRGNHDDKVVRFKGYQKKFGAKILSSSRGVMPEGKVGDPLKFDNKHTEIARAMNEDDYKYLVGCPLILDIPELNARVVHGGLDPTIPKLINNDPWSVMNMRDMNGENEPSKSKLSKNSPSSSHIHWTDAYQSFSEAHNLNVTVYYGHDASRGIALGTKTIGVDSGCVYGRKLSAIDIRTQELFQVDCVKAN